MNSHDDQTEARVRAAFAAELRQAESDLELSPLKVSSRKSYRLAGGPELRRSNRVLGVAARIAAVLAVVILASAATLMVARPWNSAMPETQSPSASASEIASPSAATPSATSSIPRYSDGIPKAWQGQPVLRWADALAMRTTAKDDAPFYVGVWLNVELGFNFGCPNEPVDPSAPNSWAVNPCYGWPYGISADAGGPYELGGEATFHFLQGDVSTGPAILRVHVHDPRATLCGNQKAVCDSMIVVESAVWTGDSYTDPKPFTVADAIAAAGAVSPQTPLELLDASNRGDDGDEILPGAIALTCGAIANSDMTVRGAYLMPSSEAMTRALPDVQPGADGAMLPSAKRDWGDASFWNRWLVVDNVAFSVYVREEPSAADKAWLASLEAALEATR
jgi:hypothetical protein